jgi:WhiB family redox-sensing transcriptional regulator
MDGMSITTMKFANDLAVTREQYVDPRPTVKPVNGERRNEAAATLDIFDFGEVFEPPAWQAEAACIGAPPGLFFSERGDNAKIAAAKKLCAQCPVREECLEFGLMEKHGVWGGLSERQRREVRRERAVVVGPLPLHRQPRDCAVCGDEFSPTSNSSTLCSDLCRATRARVKAAKRMRKFRIQQ